MLNTYILDTNVLLHDPASLFAFENNEVILPLVVIEELDSFKSAENQVGCNARSITRTLDTVRSLGNLNGGIRLSNGCLLKVELNCPEFIPDSLDKTKIDNKIIGIALGLAAGQNKKIILVSKDLNMRIKCDSLGICCQDYQKDRMVNSIEELYSGAIELAVPDEMIENFHDDLPVFLPNVNLFPNQFVRLKSETNSKKTAIGKFNKSDGSIKKIIEYKDVWGIKFKNKEQLFALNLLLDPKIQLVSLVGLAGSGKTLLALAAALQQTVEQPQVYNRIVVSRPIQPLGKDIGFLPGLLAEKMAPWIAPLNDNLEYLFDGNIKNLEILKENGTIQVEALTYIRGRSIPKSYILIDEAQQLSGHELKTIITRAGEGSKIVLTGDIQQIDNIYLDALTNGLSIVVEKFKHHEIAGHVTLTTGVRSKLATLASKIL